MAYRSPVSKTELQEVVRNGETVLLDTVTGETYSPEYAKENLDEIKPVKKVDPAAAKKAEEKAAKEKKAEAEAKKKADAEAKAKKSAEK